MRVFIVILANGYRRAICASTKADAYKRTTAGCDPASRPLMRQCVEIRPLQGEKFERCMQRAKQYVVRLNERDQQLADA